MTKKDKILIFVILILGILYETTSDKNGFINIDCGFRSSKKLLDKKYPNEFPKEKITFKNISSIYIDNKVESAGGMVIVNGEEDDVAVTSSIFVYHKDKKEAEKISSGISFNFEENKNGELKISLNNKKNFNYRRTRVYYKLILPKDKTLITLKNAYGDISVNGAHKKISIENNHGIITVSNSSSDLTLYNIKFCRLNMDRFEGNLMIDASHSFVRLDSCNFKEDLQINSRHSEIVFHNNSAKNLQINASHDNLNLKDNRFESIFCKLSHMKLNMDLNGEEKNIIFNLSHSQVSLKNKKNHDNSYNVKLYHGNFKENGKILGYTSKTQTLYNREGEGSNFIINGRYSNVKLKTD